MVLPAREPREEDDGPQSLVHLQGAFERVHLPIYGGAAFNLFASESYRMRATSARS